MSPGHRKGITTLIILFIFPIELSLLLISCLLWIIIQIKGQLL